MPRQTHTAAWDQAWERTKSVTLIGSQLDQDERRQRLQAIMGELYDMHLPIEAVYKVADAILLSWEIGAKDRPAS